MRVSILLIGSRVDAFGGIANYIKSMLNSQLDKDFSITHMPFFRLKEGNTMFISYLSLFCTIFLLNRRMVKQRFDIAHIHTAGYQSFWRTCIIIILTKIHNKKVVLQFHSAKFKEFYNACNLLQRTIIRNLIGTADRVIVLSKGWKEFYDKLSPNNKKEIVSTFVDMPIGIVKLIEKRSKKDEINLLFFSVFSERKGLKDILSILDKLLTIKDLSITVGGAIVNNEKSIYEDLLSKSKIYKNKLLVEPNVDDLRKESLYKKADIYILPSYAEGLPTTMLEAMSYGLPVITTPVGAISEVIDDGVNGYLINPGDKKQILEKVRHLAIQDNERMKLGENNHKLIKDKFTTKEVMKSFSKIYDSLSKSNEQELK